MRGRIAAVSTRVGAIVLAAGRSSRMGGRNKLLELVDGVPVVARVVREAVAGGAVPVAVVTGHQSDEVHAAVMRGLEDWDTGELPESLRARASVEVVHNRLWADGMSASIAAGVRAVHERVGGLLICLGDMPRLSAESVTALIRAYERGGVDATRPRDAEREPSATPTGTGPALPAAFVPTFAGRRGNPVLWTAEWFDALKDLDGDRGAKALLESLGDRVVEVEVPDDGVLRDVDTPDALARERRSSAAPTRASDS